jgi:hypothetical protein
VKLGISQREERRLRVFENEVLRRIFGPKKGEVTGEWGRLHNEELYALYSSPNVIRDIRLRRLTWGGHVARMGERRYSYRVLVGNREEGDHLKNPGVDGRIIIKWVSRSGLGGIDCIDLAQDTDSSRAVVNVLMNVRVL